MNTNTANIEEIYGVFTSEGNLLQNENALKAVNKSELSFSFRTSNSVYLCTVYRGHPLSYISPHKSQSNSDIIQLSENSALMLIGLSSDRSVILSKLQKAKENFKSNFGFEIPARILAKDLSIDFFRQGLVIDKRPLGVSAVLVEVPKALLEKNKNNSLNGTQVESELDKCPVILSVEPAGSFYEYLGVAYGKYRQNAKVEIEMVVCSDKESADGLVGERAKGIAKCAEIVWKNYIDERERYEVEIVRIGEEGFERVGKEEVDAAMKRASEEFE